MLPQEPKPAAQILIPRPIKKYSTDFSFAEGTEASDDVELFSPTKLMGKKGSLKELSADREVQMGLSHKFAEIETRSCNPHSYDPGFLAMDDKEVDICL